MTLLGHNMAPFTQGMAPIRHNTTPSPCATRTAKTHPSHAAKVPRGRTPMEWIPTGTGHELSIEGGKIVARNDKGKTLKSVPAAAKKTQVWEDLDSTLIFLHQHDLEVGEAVERWFLRSLPVPRSLLAAVWPDEAWRSWLTDLVVSTPDGEVAGFLRATHLDALGVVDLDGESARISDEAVLIPHPAALADLDELREFAAELGISQRFDQLFRDVHRADPAKAEALELNTWSGGSFKQLRYAAGRATAAGFKVSGGYSTCPVYEDGALVTARYWIGADSPEAETETGDLHWVRDDHVIRIGEVGPIAYSEGVRMAAHIYAGRVIDDESRP